MENLMEFLILVLIILAFIAVPIILIINIYLIRKFSEMARNISELKSRLSVVLATSKLIHDITKIDKNEAEQKNNNISDVQ